MGLDVGDGTGRGVSVGVGEGVALSGPGDLRRIGAAASCPKSEIAVENAIAPARRRVAKFSIFCCPFASHICPQRSAAPFRVSSFQRLHYTLASRQIP